MRNMAMLAVLLLAGCVLHTKTPLFADGDSVPVLGQRGLTFSVATLNDGHWVAEDDPVVKAEIEGRHYLVRDTTVPADLTKAERYYFVPLDQNRLIIQAVTGGEADYAIGTWDGKTLLVSPLDCARLKTSLKTNAEVMFLNDSCTPRPFTLPPRVLFEKLSVRAGEPELRFTKR